MLLSSSYTPYTTSYPVMPSLILVLQVHSTLSLLKCLMLCCRTSLTLDQELRRHKLEERLVAVLYNISTTIMIFSSPSSSVLKTYKLVKTPTPASLTAATFQAYLVYGVRPVTRYVILGLSLGTVILMLLIPLSSVTYNHNSYLVMIPFLPLFGGNDH